MPDKQSHYFSPPLKDLDLPFWSVSKLSVARKVGLDRRPGARVLDLGAGPGHFALVCRYYECDYLGVDLWQQPEGAPDALYDDLRGLFDYDRLDLRITPQVALDGIGPVDVRADSGNLDRGVEWIVRATSA